MSGIQWDETSRASNGGTEITARALERLLPNDLLNKFQIYLSRISTPINEKKIPILWAHNMAEDVNNKHLRNNGWKKFHKIIFVSDWQMQAYIEKYSIPWSKCKVLQNAIIPIPLHEKPTTPIRLLYTPTPNRGLDLLYSVFNRLCEKHDDIELSVFSSFELYGWEKNDTPFKPLFEALSSHPKITYTKYKENTKIREALLTSHIFAYPSTWKETSCLCLIEAMSAGLICVHPRYGALSETAANWTRAYPWHEDKKKHQKLFQAELETAITLIKEKCPSTQEKLKEQVTYNHNFYNLEARVIEWKHYLQHLLSANSAS